MEDRDNRDRATLELVYAQVLNTEKACKDAESSEEQLQLCDSALDGIKQTLKAALARDNGRQAGRKCPGGIYRGKSFGSLGLTDRRDVAFKATGEFRAPLRGEYYLSGAIIAAYRAPNDLTTEYWIAKPGGLPSRAG